MYEQVGFLGEWTPHKIDWFKTWTPFTNMVNFDPSMDK